MLQRLNEANYPIYYDDHKHHLHFKKSAFYSVSKSRINSSSIWPYGAYIPELSFKYSSLFCIFPTERSEAYHQILSLISEHTVSQQEAFLRTNCWLLFQKYCLYIYVEWVPQKFKTECGLFALSRGIEKSCEQPFKEVVSLRIIYFP